jgi:hypothetical protein
MWHCICDCGGEKTCQANALTYKATKSCGCINKEKIREEGLKKRKHAMCDTKEYRAWGNMKRRCYDPTVRSYRNYGARGITVCDRWINSFENFISDVGLAPSRFHSLDRIDNAGNYEPSNVKWSTVDEQHHNRRTNRIVEYKGRSMPLSLWCRELGLDYKKTRQRLCNGWSAERAFNDSQILSNKFETAA